MAPKQRIASGMNSVEGFAECLEIKTLIPNGEWNEDGHTIVPDLQMVKQL
ncbi:hypothetical protein HPP92_018294 [Vanilla planifolia]|uniref:Uncharacterized protein n=1 Tax=Vanilla planifolia TaxID=51239 RepID=A0A835Q6S8_VANPL|nr:hypothetical protein HPP92_018294 [Vanilla planifolia]